jgi:hypothetical protein
MIPENVKITFEEFLQFLKIRNKKTGELTEVSFNQLIVSEYVRCHVPPPFRSTPINVEGYEDASPEMTKKYQEWEKNFLKNEVKWFPPNDT